MLTPLRSFWKAPAWPDRNGPGGTETLLRVGHPARAPELCQQRKTKSARRSSHKKLGWGRRLVFRAPATANGSRLACEQPWDCPSLCWAIRFRVKKEHGVCLKTLLSSTSGRRKQAYHLWEEERPYIAPRTSRIPHNFPHLKGFGYHILETSVKQKNRKARKRKSKLLIKYGDDLGICSQKPMIKNLQLRADLYIIFPSALPRLFLNAWGTGLLSLLWHACLESERFYSEEAFPSHSA